MSSVLYIHGFLSSPQSHKAQLVQRWLADNKPDWEYHCPELTAYPKEAIDTLEGILKNRCNQVYLIGSSLGGFYATYLSQRFDLKAVLVNPAVKPYDLMLEYLGRDLRNYHNENLYKLNRSHIQQLKRLQIGEIRQKENLWLLAQTGDEVLDYRAAKSAYQDCLQNIEKGGDHSFQNFELWIPKIINFFES